MSFRLLLCAVLAACTLGFADQPASPASIDAKEFLARSVARLALIDLRAASAPQEADYKIAHLLLGMATEACPGDAEILRRKIEAAYACGDDKSVLESTQALVRLQPSDTVAQLRLITALIADKAQIAEDRLQVYDQFIGDKRIDAAIRSRLALDAALLLRERGDDEAFRRKLSTACQLDSSHKEAAALAAAVIADRRPDDVMGRFQALQNLLMADPLDPNVHLAICRELVNARAFKAARRFRVNAANICQVAQVAGERDALEAMVLEMLADGPIAAAASINEQLQLSRDAVARDFRAAETAGRPTEKLRKPEDVHLSSNSHILYILALAAGGDAQAASASLTDFASYIAVHSTQVVDLVRRGQMSSEDALRTTAELASQLQMTRFITGLQLDMVQKDLEDAKTAGFVEKYPATFRAFEPWRDARDGNYDKAIEAFEADVEANSYSQLGIALAHELAGRTPQAIENYNAVLARSPLEPGGAWAHSRLLALGQKDDPTAVRAMEAAAAKIPAWIDAMALEPHRFEQLSVEVINRDPSAIDRGYLRVKLQNLSQIPLAVGADRPLSSRLLLSPKLEAVSGGTVELMKPEVGHLDRRIRLLPNESIEADLWPDAGQCGLLMESLANRSVRVRWRVVQGFQSDRRGGFIPGVMGLSTESSALIRRPLSESTLSVAGLAKQVTEGPISGIGRLAAVTRAEIMQPILLPKVVQEPPNAPAIPGGAPNPPPAPEPVDLTPVAGAFAARYAKLGPAERCMLIVTLPHARLAPLMQPVDQVMRNEADPAALMLVLATRVFEPQDELLTRCKESDDPRLREMANLMQQRLSGPILTYARWTAADIGNRAAAQPAEAPPVPQ